MDINTIYKIKQNPTELKYLREHSYWYKYLNRDQRYYAIFKEKLKEEYKLTTEDRIKKIASTIDNISKIIDILN